MQSRRRAKTLQSSRSSRRSLLSSHMEPVQAQGPAGGPAAVAAAVVAVSRRLPHRGGLAATAAAAMTMALAGTPPCQCWRLWQQPWLHSLQPQALASGPGCRWVLLPLPCCCVCWEGYYISMPAGGAGYPPARLPS